MDQIEVISSTSSASSCSNISYQGTDAYISDGEDPYIQPIEPQSEDEYQFQEEEEEEEEEESELQQDSFQQSFARVKTEEQHAEQRRKRQKRQQCKQIMNELKFGRNTTLLLNLNANIPRYEQIQNFIKQINVKYQTKSLKKIISKLYTQLVIKPKQKIKQQKLQYLNSCQKWRKLTVKDRQRWLAQRRLVAQAFVQLGYGITKMRKFIEQHQINIQIDIVTYQQIIVKLLKDAYHRLQRFLRKKCYKKVIKLSTPTEQKYLLQILKNCRHKLDKFEIHNLFKLIKPTYIKNQTFKLSKRIASRLYHSCKEYISRKKIKVGLINLDTAECQLFNNDRAKWTTQIIQNAVNLYIKQGSLNRVREIMSKTCDVQHYLIDNRNIKYHIANKVKQGLEIIQKNIGQYIKGNLSVKIKEMVELDSQRVSQIVNHAQATNVRIMLLQIYKNQSPSTIQINQAILAVNEFILKRDNDKMREQIKKTNRQYDPRQIQFLRRRRSKKR